MNSDTISDTTDEAISSKPHRLFLAAQAMLSAFGGNVPDWLSKEVGELELAAQAFAQLAAVSNHAYVGEHDPYVCLDEVRMCLDGLQGEITEHTVDDNYVTRAFYFAELGLGMRRAFPVR